MAIREYTGMILKRYRLEQHSCKREPCFEIKQGRNESRM
jgi:hypothetical protein